MTTAVLSLATVYDAAAQESPYIAEASGIDIPALFYPHHESCKTRGQQEMIQFPSPGAEAHGQESGIFWDIHTADYLEPETTSSDKTHKNLVVTEAVVSCSP